MYQVFRLLALVFIGLTNFILFGVLFYALLSYIDSGQNIMNAILSLPTLFSLTGFALSFFTYYSFGVLEEIKIKAKALDVIYNGSVTYKNYLEEKGGK